MNKRMKFRKAITVASACGIVAVLAGVAWAWPNYVCCGFSYLGGSVHTEALTWANGNLSYDQRGEFWTELHSVEGLCYAVGQGNFPPGNTYHMTTFTSAVPLGELVIEHGRYLLTDVVDTDEAALQDPYFCRNGREGKNPWLPAAGTTIATSFFQTIKITECPDKDVECSDAERIIKRIVERDCVYEGPITPEDLLPLFLDPQLTFEEWFEASDFSAEDLEYSCKEEEVPVP
jgi:hypothetical protein